ncbi:MAG: ABC transporter ATP-binding protein [Verrucomicrobia bacterium]|nr:ABC transporter ATP-binding protein [Verrucomicrobiota bacterium]
MSTPSPIAVKVENVVKSFANGDSRTFALKGASLEARFGELLMIVGPSGCGKTTLLSVICGTLKFEEGDVAVFGQELRAMRNGDITRFRRENIGFIFQQFNLIPTLTAVENVSIPLILKGVSTAQAEKRACEVLEKVGLADKYKSYPSQLSGGQQQRVAISRALVHEPRLRCVIIVTHDSRIYEFADRIVQMDDGRVVGQFDDPSQLSHA